MKKSRYGLIGAVLILAMMLGQITSVRGTTYTCAGSVGAEAIWRVKTVHEGSLTAIFGASWKTSIQNSFGPGSQELGARLKTKVTHINSSQNVIGFETCNITSDLWTWTTKSFGPTPNVTGVPTYILLHPKNLTFYCQFYSGYTKNVSEAFAYPFLNALPIPAATYLSELIWDNDYVISGTTVTHNLVAPYVGLVLYLVNCTETWRYSSSYGTFLGYKLVHNNGTTAYETVLETPSAAIPGFELSIVIGASMGIVISLIFVVMKKKR